jgi:ketosteroid isomerase-like protein
MKRLLIVAVTLVAAYVPAVSQQQVGDDFKDLIKRYYAAWNTLNPDNSAVFYAKDPDLVFYDIDPLKYTGWQQYYDGFKKTVGPSFASLTLAPKDDLKVTRRGNIVLTTLTFHLSAKTKDGTSLDFDCRHTAVWEKRGKSWLIIHEHVSKPLS